MQCLSNLNFRQELQKNILIWYRCSLRFFFTFSDISSNRLVTVLLKKLMAKNNGVLGGIVYLQLSLSICLQILFLQKTSASLLPDLISDNCVDISFYFCTFYCKKMKAVEDFVSLQTSSFWSAHLVP